MPDITLSGGIRVLPTDGSVGFVLGLSLPLPVFDRKQGRVAAASRRVSKVRAASRAARIELEARIIAAYTQARVALDALERLDGGILPTARTAYEAAVEAYRAGKAGYLSVLDAQATLLELQAERVEAARRLFHALTELQGLLGRPVGRSVPAKGRHRRATQ